MSSHPSASTDRSIDRAWVAVACLVPLIVGLMSRMGATDLAYQLRAGEQILHGSVPRVDTFTFSVFGQPWTDQQWGAQAVMALIFRAGSWPTLVAAQGLLVGLTFSLVYLAARQARAPRRASSLLTLGGFLVSVPGLAMRPQLLALPLFAGLLWIVAGREAHPRRLWLAPLFTGLCTNLHGSFPLFVLVLGLAWLEDLRRRPNGASRTLIVTGASMVATLANPFGIKVWTYVYDLSTNPVIRNTISEWAPTTLASLPGWLTIVSAVAVAAFLVVRRQPLPWTDAAALIAFFLLAMSAQRAIVWWGLVAPVVVAGTLHPTSRDQGTTVRSTRSREGKGPARVVVAGLVITAIALAPWFRGSDVATFVSAAPPGLTDAVEQLPAGSRLMVHQPWGSWFEFAVPQDLVFVDSRIEIIPADVWKDYGQVGFAGADWRDVLDRWDVDAIVADADWELLDDLLSDPAWHVLYTDADGYVFERMLTTG